MKINRHYRICVFTIMLCLAAPQGYGQETQDSLDLAQSIEEKDGKRISLDLKGVEIAELFRVLSTKMGVTIVPSKMVQGRINVYLNNVTYPDALDIVLFTEKLASEKRGNILYVMTEEEYKQMYGRNYIEKRDYASVHLKFAQPSTVFSALSELKSDIGKILVDENSGSIILIDIPERLELMEEVIQQLDTPLETYVFDLNYAKADDIKAKLQDVLTPGTGKIIADGRSAKLIISDLPSKMDRIKRVLKNLDEEERQVFIEAEIVQINLTDNFKKGIDWERIFSARVDDLKLDFNFPNPSALSSFGKVAVGSLSRDKYTALLELLKTYGDVKILSRPRIAVTNNQEAKILVGSKDAYVSQTLSQANTTTVTSESVTFIDVGVKLNVTPVINKEGYIIMQIKPEVSSVGSTIQTTLGSRIPIVETSEAQTVVKVRDGATIMIAGLMKREKRNDKSGLPFLSGLPVIGSIFSSADKRDIRTEIVVFLTPHIISGDSPLDGMEFERYLPSEMKTEDGKKEVIRPGTERTKPISGSEAKGSLLNDHPSNAQEQTSGVKDKLKGFKKFK